MAEKTPLKVLYVEDEPDLRERISIILEMEFAEVLLAANGKEGLELFLARRPDLVISDIRMPVMDGLEMTRGIRNAAPDTPVIFCTAFTETPYLLRAIELSVSAYVRKPLDCRQLVQTAIRCATPILQRRELEQARRSEEASLQLLLGESGAMREVLGQAQRVAATDFSLLIQGETGVGKSHLASLIHDLSRRKHGPLVTVTISALPAALVESQLFGHLRGAFTGAVTSVRGLFEEADGGTLFLDDVDCAPPEVQAKILHAVEGKGFFPVGGTKPVRVDTRIIAASNRDLLRQVQQGNFREDLFYRLAEVGITLPPLRERGDDIAVLARKFLLDVARELERTPPRLAPDAPLLLQHHPWPGNVRELKSTMKRVALFCGAACGAEELAGLMTGAAPSPSGKGAARLLTLEELKRESVRQALAATGGRKMEASRLLDVDYSSFKRMLDKYKL